MKVLAFSDTHLSAHAERKLLEKIKVHKPDLLLCCGDFTIFMNEAMTFLQMIRKTKITTLLIHGNHEDEESIQMLSAPFSSIIFLHGKTHKHDNVLFLGYGGGGFSKEDIQFKRHAKHFSKEVLTHQKTKNQKTVFLLHQPPYNSGIDAVYGSLAGCLTTRQFIDAHHIDYVFAGHLHEHFGKDKKIGKTHFINPGPTGIIINI